MKKKYYLLFLMISIVFCINSCKKQEGDIEKGQNGSYLRIYGKELPLMQAAGWKGLPYKVYNKEEYIFKDEYLVNNLPVVDDVVGYRTTNESVTSGNFVLSFYGGNLNVDKQSYVLTGNGPAISFHLTSSNVDKISPGIYNFKPNAKEPFTFTAYYSSNFYHGLETNLHVEVESGTLTIKELDATTYSIEFTGLSSNNTDMVLNYKGSLDMYNLEKREFSTNEGIQLFGLAKEKFKTWMHTASNRLPPDDWSSVFNYEDFDYNMNKSLLFSPTGGLRLPAMANKDQADIALIYSKSENKLFFESPIRVRSYLGHNNLYNHPVHTIYQRVPASFTSADFENFKESDFPAELVEEDIEVNVNTVEFRPFYFYFESGNGTRGVVHVTRIRDAVYEYSNVSNFIFYQKEVSPSLFLDIKCPSIFNNPKIR